MNASVVVVGVENPFGSRCRNSRSRVAEPESRMIASPMAGLNCSSSGRRSDLILLRVITVFSPLRSFVPLSVASVALGGGYGLWGIATDSRIPNGAVLLIVLGVFVFLIGLVSDQISTLRFERRGRD